MPMSEIRPLDQVLNLKTPEEKTNALITIAYDNNRLGTENHRMICELPCYKGEPCPSAYTQKQKAINYTSAGGAFGAFILAAYNIISSHLPK
jgi:hypothetical protein